MPDIGRQHNLLLNDLLAVIDQYPAEDLVDKKAEIMKNIYRQSYAKSGLGKWVGEDVILNRADTQEYGLFDMQYYEQ